MVLVTLAAGLLAVWRVYGEPFRRQRETMTLIEVLGGRYETEAGSPAWMRDVFGAPHFQHITFADVADCDDPSRFLGQVVSLPRLRTLVVGGRSLSDEHLRRLQVLETLRVLVLDSTSVTDEAVAEIKQVMPDLVVYRSQRRAIAAVRKFRFAHVATQPCQVDADLRRTIGDDYFQDPIGVHLRGSGIGDADLQHLEGFTSLRSLVLSETKITDAGLASLRRLSQLQILHAEDTKIGDVGLVHLKGCTDLRILLLNNTKVTDAGLVCLEGWTKLEQLYLRNTGVSDASVTRLKGLAQLIALDLTPNQLSQASLRDLQMALPDCLVPGLKERGLIVKPK